MSVKIWNRDEINTVYFRTASVTRCQCVFVQVARWSDQPVLKDQFIRFMAAQAKLIEITKLCKQIRKNPKNVTASRTPSYTVVQYCLVTSMLIVIDWHYGQSVLRSHLRYFDKNKYQEIQVSPVTSFNIPLHI